MLNIVEFYPSITVTILSKVLDWASTITDYPRRHQRNHMSCQEITALQQTNGTGSIPWIKKNGLSDVTMGLFLLNEVKNNFPDLDYSLYRDDGLTSHRWLGGRKLEQIRQGLLKLFEMHLLKILWSKFKYFSCNQWGPPRQCLGAHTFYLLH